MRKGFKNKNKQNWLKTYSNNQIQILKLNFKNSIDYKIRRKVTEIYSKKEKRKRKIRWYK